MEFTSAEPLVRQVLIESTAPALDKVLFSANAAGLDRPAGLLFGIAPLNAAGVAGTKAENLVDDVQTLATAIAPVAGNNGIVLVAAPAQAVAIQMRLARDMGWPILTSTQLAAGTVIAIAANTLVAAVEGIPEIDASRSVGVIIHEETSPAPIVSAGGVMATPVRSMFQTDSVALRVKWPICWALRDPRGVAWMSGVNW